MKLTTRQLTLLISIFWTRVDKTKGQGPKGDCWEWLGCKDRRGYAIFPAAKQLRRASRFAYFIKTGVVLSSDILVRHSCDNLPCVRPLHISKGTNKDNTQDMIIRNRYRSIGNKGEANTTAKLQSKDIKAIRKMCTGFYGQYVLVATKFNVTPVLISKIVRRLLWSHI